MANGDGLAVSDNAQYFSEVPRGDDSQSHESVLPRGPRVPSYLVVDRDIAGISGEVVENVAVALDIAKIRTAVVERLTANGLRVLRAKGYDEQRVTEGLRKGVLTYLSESDVSAFVEEAESGIGITGGGACAGIADCVSSFAQNLDEPNIPLALRHAGEGLIVNPAKFKKSLIFVDDLLVADMAGKASTPFGSTRVDAHTDENLGVAFENLAPYKFIYGTGGNGNLTFMEVLSDRFPDKVVVASPKTIDGDVTVNGRKVQMLGFHTAVQDCQKELYSLARNASAHKLVQLVQVAGKNWGRLVYEAGRIDPANLQELERNSEARDLYHKILELGPTMTLLVPERPVSLLAIAAEVTQKKKEFGSCTVALAEGFVPTDLRNYLAKCGDFVSKAKTVDHEVNKNQLLGFLRSLEDTPEKEFLMKILRDPELFEQFFKLILTKNLFFMKDFVGAAIEKFGDNGKVREAIISYEVRGPSPSDYDRVMGQKIGKKMAELVNKAELGGYAVVYLEEMDAMTEDPEVIPLKNVGDNNNLMFYSNQELRASGVFC